MKKIIYLLVAVLSVSAVSGCGCAKEKKPHPNVIITTEEPAPEYCGSWAATVDGNTIDLDLNADGKGRVEVKSPDGEVITNAQGGWGTSGDVMVFDFYDTVENKVWRADYDSRYNGEGLSLTCTRGREFCEGTETYEFTRP